ncbi:DNA polymerase III subunit epsilon [Rubrivivax benzoatilyticus]|uniref:DNA polymerase III subunit epsilon n=1 Tax=Rubrivivax benzoatilyticus TaxID=316997 RepID=A0ABX0I3C0_9BURK|nr:DNA polymerase III subunit epsilon [Rubrivivax benzoatilyticus]EGJ09844.1 DNA polymerase III subunit epsilon [Rubrivivax benzoatilyticus JA2 = ATCC BAA-35]NHL00302.1 DNA polymerase III subunit epsilon [Rubrivivax benzoatilyticus]NHL26103.1 DNA polymerase III subunit epsilon [Rubrivivax benzoatilyticus]
MRQIFLDTETTGLSAVDGDRLVEVGCIEMLNRRLSGRTLHHYLNPERSSNPEAVKVHGLTDEFLADKPLFAAVADEFIEFVRDAELIIHNAAFDVGFLDAELTRLGKPRLVELGCTITDSLVMARQLFPGKANSLDALCKRLEVDNSNRALHGALLDAGLLAEVYIRMTRGQDSLVIDDAQEGGTALEVAAIDLSQFTLPVLVASDEEAAAHEAVLAELDKASNGRTIWRQTMA